MEDKRKKGLFYNLFNYGAEYDEFEDDFDCDYKDSWFHRQYQETAYKNGIKRSVQEKLFTDKKLTFEEYTTLLEIVTEKFRDSFNCNNGKFDIPSFAALIKGILSSSNFHLRFSLLKPVFGIRPISINC